MDCPSQNNTFDCGLYTIMFAKCVYFDESMDVKHNLFPSSREFFKSKFRDEEIITYREKIWNYIHK